MQASCFLRGDNWRRYSASWVLVTALLIDFLQPHMSHAYYADSGSQLHFLANTSRKLVVQFLGGRP